MRASRTSPIVAALLLLSAFFSAMVYGQTSLAAALERGSVEERHNAPWGHQPPLARLYSFARAMGLASPRAPKRESESGLPTSLGARRTRDSQ